MEFENLVKLIQAVSDSELTQFAYRENGVNISMKKDKKQKLVTVNGSNAGGMLDMAAFELEGEKSLAGQKGSQAEGNVVKSPLVGTFYSAQSPDAEPFVKVGDTVSKGQVLGIVEAMKLMNEIESDYAGTVKQVLVSNEEVVEFGQPLFVIG
ncbi:MAG: acetyl-CoA carboxylase biotin carboxyl carrier protein [Lachnospiraceae bacterium]|nr:acetyl-CoA carboxylase biotin carboxyl carrier protein [Lachnospiraceae bacterium]MCI9645935.1 acetyl-CoA carboxylase biotin carboxyl carrier protein [Lachnospiraceae bacterium]